LYTNFHPYRSLTNYVQVALPKPEWTQLSYNYRNEGIAEKPSMESCSPTQMKENYQVLVGVLYQT